MRTSLIACAVSIACAQSQPVSSPPLIFIGGTVEAVSGNVVYVDTGLQLIALSVDGRTEIWKGKALPDVSTVEAGDEIVAGYRTDASGKHLAASMRLNGVNFFAVITHVAGSGFEVFTNPNADPQSGYRKETKIVTLDADTIFEASAREDLKQGRDVQVMGLDLKNGTVRATRVTVYEGNKPVRMGNVRIILPNGQIR